MDIGTLTDQLLHYQKQGHSHCSRLVKTSPAPQQPSPHTAHPSHSTPSLHTAHPPLTQHPLTQHTPHTAHPPLHTGCTPHYCTHQDGPWCSLCLLLQQCTHVEPPAFLGPVCVRQACVWVAESRQQAFFIAVVESNMDDIQGSFP